MKITHKVIRLLIVFFLIHTGCKEDRVPNRGSMYLKSLIYHRNADQIRNYYYNEQGKLLSREYVFDNKVIEVFKYSYEADNLVCVDYYGLNSYEDYTLHHKESLAFEYDFSGINKATLYPDKSTVSYEYENGNVIKAIQSAGNYTVYQCDNKGNIIESVVFAEGNEQWKFIYEYDNRKNPFYSIDPIHNSFSAIDLIRYKCPNNLIYELFINEDNDTISESEYIYEYDINYLPVRSYELYTSKMNGYDNDTTQTLIYEYEVRQ